MLSHNEQTSYQKVKSVNFQEEAKTDLELYRKYKNNGCEESREKLILRQQYRVKQIAKKHSQWKNGLSYEDLLQQGWVGIIRAVEIYDESLNVPFNYYAAQWCTAMMNKGIYDSGRTVRTPVSTAVSINKMKVASNVLYGSLGREPTDAEVAAEIGIKEKKVKRLKTSDISVQSVNCKNSSDDSEYEHILTSMTPNAAESLLKSEYSHDIKCAINTVLDESEKKVINEYFGLTCDKPKTLEELGPSVNRTKPGVRLIKIRALNKIKNYLNKDSRK